MSIASQAIAARHQAEIAVRHAEWDELKFSPFEPVFMFANRLGYSDIHPYEVVRRVSDKTIEIREMSARRDEAWKPEFVAGGFSAHCTNQDRQQWIITSNPAAPVIRIRKQKDGQWKDASGARFGLTADPVKFYDFNF